MYRFIEKEKEADFKKVMVSASFTAWQILSAQVQKFPKWSKYISSLGLLDKPKNDRKALIQEAEDALKKVEAIRMKARK